MVFLPIELSSRISGAMKRSAPTRIVRLSGSTYLWLKLSIMETCRTHGWSTAGQQVLSPLPESVLLYLCPVPTVVTICINKQQKQALWATLSRVLASVCFARRPVFSQLPDRRPRSTISASPQRTVCISNRNGHHQQHLFKAQP